MGQLDSIEINELFFVGLIAAIIPAYAAEGIDSTIESIKVYVYSAVGLIGSIQRSFSSTYDPISEEVRPGEKKSIIISPGDKKGRVLAIKGLLIGCKGGNRKLHRGSLVLFTPGNAYGIIYRVVDGSKTVGGSFLVEIPEMYRDHVNMGDYVELVTWRPAKGVIECIPESAWIRAGLQYDPKYKIWYKDIGTMIVPPKVPPYVNDRFYKFLRYLSGKVRHRELILLLHRIENYYINAKWKRNK